MLSVVTSIASISEDNLNGISVWNLIISRPLFVSFSFSVLSVVRLSRHFVRRKVQCACAAAINFRSIVVDVKTRIMWKDHPSIAAEDKQTDCQHFCLSVSLSAFLCLYPSVYLCIFSTACVCICLPIFVFVHLSICFLCLSVCLSVSLSLCLSVSLYAFISLSSACNFSCRVQMSCM